MSKKIKNSNKDSDLGPITNRLDALIRISLEFHLDKNNKFNLTAAVKALNSCGLGPSDIANILGKKITDVSPLLYTKKKTKPEQAVTNVEPKEDSQDV